MTSSSKQEPTFLLSHTHTISPKESPERGNLPTKCLMFQMYSFCASMSSRCYTGTTDNSIVCSSNFKMLIILHMIVRLGFFYLVLPYLVCTESSLDTETEYMHHIIVKCKILCLPHVWVEMTKFGTMINYADEVSGQDKGEFSRSRIL